ncbi:MFS transporter [Cytophagaceae bacterium ABcell3]|nr:MFS transporter [Cytophagaceae bacterium ABcell3]
MFKLFTTLNKKALFHASIAFIVVILLVYTGSRNLQNFDAALISYLFGTIFAVFGIVYRYSVWVQRPPTRLYWRRTWRFAFSRSFPPYVWYTIKQFVKNILFQRFIYPRGRTRWVGHFLLATGCMLAFAITFPLTFGWIHFTLKPDTFDIYVANFFGFPVMEFPLGSVGAFIIFHALNWCSWLVIVGVVLMFRRRMTNAGLIATQTFEGDLLPLILLLIISITGLGLTYDYAFLQGRTFEFMSVTHAISVILFLVWLPFGKFFHIFQRPAQLGTNIYKKQGAKLGMAVCPHTGEEFASQLHINDLKTVTKQLDFDFSYEDGKNHLDLSPEGKRSALAKAQLAARNETGKFFG